jgi:hypothetical protein
MYDETVITSYLESSTVTDLSLAGTTDGRYIPAGSS